MHDEKADELAVDRTKSNHQSASRCAVTNEYTEHAALFSWAMLAMVHRLADCGWRMTMQYDSPSPTVESIVIFVWWSRLLIITIVVSAQAGMVHVFRVCFRSIVCFHNVHLEVDAQRASY